MGRQGPGYISPTVQREAIQRWADFRKVEISEWITDEDESGGTQNRPGLRRAMAMIEAHESDGLACWRLNRFARNVSDAIADVEKIHAAGGHLACVEEDIDPTGPFGRFILTILLAVATLERDNLCASLEDAKKRALARGAYISRTPIGYRRDGDGLISPDPRFGPIIAEAFRIAATEGVTRAAEYLQPRIPTTTMKGVERRRRWNAASARRVFASRVYLGDTVYGKGDARTVIKGAHEALVTRAVWEAAQTSPATRSDRRSYPLSGVPVCTTCEQHLVGAAGGNKGGRNYRCAGGIVGAKVRCPRPVSVTAHLIEEYVREQALALVPGLTASIGEGDELAALEDALAQAEEELQAFAADQTARRVLGASYSDHLLARGNAETEEREAYRAQAAVSQRALKLSAEELLSADDPLLFQAGLEGIFAKIVVRPGRGIPIEDRVGLFPVQPDGSAGVASA